MIRSRAASHALLPLLAVMLTARGQTGDPATTPAALVPTNLVVLFNGTNLAGLTPWLVDSRHADPRGVFRVTNGLIRISGDGLGYLATEQAYRDYRLVAEYRWGRTNWPWADRIGRARDSGIFLHAWGPDGNSHDGHGAFKAAIECNVFQGATGDFLLIRGADAEGRDLAPRLTAEIAESTDPEGWPYWQAGGQRRAIERWGRLNWGLKDRAWRDVLDMRGPHDRESPPGAWTRLECVCDGPQIRIFVNGTLVNEALDVFPRQGQILLQCEGSEIFFRRLELHPLTR